MTRRVNRSAGRDQAGAWAEAVRRDAPWALARMLSLIEARAPFAREVLERLYPFTGRAYAIGVTGAAGSGKSTLIARLAEELRRRDQAVGILTVDPTSPLTGGALLGDRVRMRELFLDRGVFIRSLASRGQTGGIAGALAESVQVLDAAGKQFVLIETIGVGQDQVDIASIADTVVLVITPESGDEVQALKAGVIELADLFVINKADLPGAAALREQLAGVLDLEEPRLHLTSAFWRGGENGVGALLDALERHRVQLRANGQGERRSIAGARAQLLAALREALAARVEEQLTARELDDWARQIAARRVDPRSAAERLLATRMVARPGAPGKIRRRTQ